MGASLADGRLTEDFSTLSTAVPALWSKQEQHYLLSQPPPSPSTHPAFIQATTR